MPRMAASGIVLGFTRPQRRDDRLVHRPPPFPHPPLTRYGASFWATRDFQQGRRRARLGPGVRRVCSLLGCPPGCGCGSLSVCSPPGTVTRRGSSGDCPARSSTAHLAVLTGTRRSGRTVMMKVIIGVDPHKLSATIEVVDHHEKLQDPSRWAGGRVAGSLPVRRWPLARRSPGKGRRAPPGWSRGQPGPVRGAGA